MPFSDIQPRLNVSMVKNQSRKLVFRRIFRDYPVTRAEIVTDTSLSHGTVRTIVDELLAAHVIEERKDISAPVGRKPKKIFLRRDACVFAVIHVQPGSVDLHVVDLALDPILPSDRLHVGAQRGYETAIAEAVGSLCDERSAAPRPVGLGVVVPGYYDPVDDRVVCRLVPELRSIPILERLRASFAGPIVIEEDVHVAALAETSYPYEATQPLFYLYANRGVGGAYIDDGRLLLGASRMAGEIGQIVMANGRRLEELVGWPTFLAASMPSQPGVSATSFHEIVEELRRRLGAEDASLVAALQDVVDHLSVAIGHMTCILNPKTVLIGGPYALLGEPFFRLLRARVLPALIPEHREPLTIAPAAAGDYGMIRGAATLALEAWLVDELNRGGYAE